MTDTVLAHGSALYGTVAAPVGTGAPVSELIGRLERVQKNCAHPLIAAKHIGLDLQVFIIDHHFQHREATAEKLVVLNPELVGERAPLVSLLESDVSLPGLSVSIDRPRVINVRYRDEVFAEQEVSLDGWSARWMQRGIDLLNGRTILDRMNRHRKRSIKGHLHRIADGKYKTDYELKHEPERTDRSKAQ